MVFAGQMVDLGRPGQREQVPGTARAPTLSAGGRRAASEKLADRGRFTRSGAA
jgi:hypothetical protein